MGGKDAIQEMIKDLEQDPFVKSVLQKLGAEKIFSNFHEFMESEFKVVRQRLVEELFQYFLNNPDFKELHKILGLPVEHLSAYQIFELLKNEQERKRIATIAMKPENKQKLLHFMEIELKKLFK